MNFGYIHVWKPQWQHITEEEVKAAVTAAV